MTYLLDVNVLIALIDPGHVQHDIAHDWFARDGASAWATCPITENAALRILGHASYPNSPGTPAAVAICSRWRKPMAVNWRHWTAALSSPPFMVGPTLFA